MWTRLCIYLLLLARVGFASNDFFCDFMDATDGGHVVGWDRSDCADISTLCNQGNRVTCVENSVRSIALPNFRINGTIPTSVGTLTDLTKLSLEANRLDGTIPHTITQLVNMKELKLNSNRLVGNIPSMAISTMTLLYLHENRLVGSIPSTFASMSAMRFLKLNNNLLIGSIPPISFGVNLNILYLHYNSLYGSLPSALAYHSALTGLYLHTNSLTGSLPSSFACLTALKELRLNSNSLLPTFPAALCSMPLLSMFYLTQNAMHQCQAPTAAPTLSYNSIETTFLCDFLAATDIDSKGILGWDSCGAFMTGEKCSAYGLICVDGHIEKMDLGNLNITGTIPSSIRSLSRLKSLIFTRNSLRNFPSSIGSMSMLTDLRVDMNPIGRWRDCK